MILLSRFILFLKKLLKNANEMTIMSMVTFKNEVGASLFVDNLVLILGSGCKIQLFER